MISTQFDDGIVRITLRAPPLNILTREMLLELREALRDTAHRRDARVLLLTADGKHFSAGASVEEHLPPTFEQLLDDFTATVLALHEFPLPVIAAVQGRCLGGAFELIQAADIIIAADDAQFAQPEILLGVFPPIACVLLPRLASPGRAAELLFTGDAIDAHAALAAGLVSRIVTRGTLAEQAHELAHRIARHSAAALRLMKQAMRAAAGETARAGIVQATCTYTDQLMSTRDALEGLQAFVQKRAPQWSHQ
ncbi:MAG TPA: enoyl-CoA hydratase/isomerase family protein [Longimicrobiales bacterium]|nr:enoyl-CoA hydratase/isomerase family protein [Longimicrobiales bacterium]